MFFLAVLAMMLCSSTARLWAQQTTPLMEQINAALEKASTLLDEKKYAEALKAANDAVEFLPQPVKENYKPYAVMCYGNLSWSLTLNKQYAPAMEAAKKALTFAAGDAEWIEGNLAHAYLMSGQTQEAEKIYRKYIGKVFGSEKQSWVDVMLADFKSMKAAGVSSSDMDKIEKMFELESTKERALKGFTFKVSITKEFKEVLLHPDLSQNFWSYRQTQQYKADEWIIRTSPNGEYTCIVADNRVLENNSKGASIYFVCVFETNSGQLVASEGFGPGDFYDIQFTPDGKQIAILQKSGGILAFYDIKSLTKPLRTVNLNVPASYGDKIEESEESSHFSRHKYQFMFSGKDNSIVVRAKWVTGVRYEAEKMQKCRIHFFDIVKESVKGSTVLEISNQGKSEEPFRLGLDVNGSWGKNIVWSKDEKFLCVALYYYGNRYARKHKAFSILSVDELSTGKGKLFEVEFKKEIEHVVDITPEGNLWQGDNIDSKDLPPDVKDLLKKNGVPAFKGELNSLTGLYNIGKINNDFSGWSERSRYFAFQDDPASGEYFHSFLPDGKRGIFTSETDEGLQVFIRNIEYEQGEQNKKLKHLGNLAVEKDRAEDKADKARDREIQEQLRVGEQFIKQEKQKIKNVKSGAHVHISEGYGLVIQRKGDMVLIQMDKESAKDAKWHPISDIDRIWY